MQARTWQLLPASAVLVDALVVGISLAVARTAGGVLLAIALHLVVAGAFGVLLSLWLARVGREVGLRLALLGAAIGFFVPLLGSAALTMALHVLIVTQPKSDEPRFQRFKPPDALTRRAPTELVPRIVTDRLVHLVRHGRSIETRFRAVLQSNDVPAVVAVPVLKAALADAAEEVRLSAFSQIEKMRRAIDLRIEKARGELQGDLPPARAHAVHAALAQDYYEIAYLGLAEGEVYKHALKEALSHADRALAIAKGDGPMLRLVARIRLRQTPGDAKVDIKQALDAARDAGIPMAELATDYAEEAFRRRAYDEVARVLGAMGGVSHDYVLLARMQEFWRWQ